MNRPMSLCAVRLTTITRGPVFPCSRLRPSTLTFLQLIEHMSIATVSKFYVCHLTEIDPQETLANDRNRGPHFRIGER